MPRETGQGLGYWRTFKDADPHPCSSSEFHLPVSMLMPDEPQRGASEQGAEDIYRPSRTCSRIKNFLRFIIIVMNRAAGILDLSQALTWVSTAVKLLAMARHWPADGIRAGKAHVCGICGGLKKSLACLRSTLSPHQKTSDTHAIH